MVIHPIFYYTGGYFFIGGILNAIIASKKKTEEKRQLWVKFFVYVLVVHGIIISVLLGRHLFTMVAIIISITGIYELFKAQEGKPEALEFYRKYMFFFLIAAFSFIPFSFSPFEQILYLYMLVISFDGFSQLSGQLFGRHLFVPEISPNKTIEGVAGGWLFCIITAIFIRHWIGLSLIESLIAGTLVGFSALAGDLLASYYKRKMGIKDFGTIIPGHGGILDRFDSLIAVGAFYFILMTGIGLIEFFG